MRFLLDKGADHTTMTDDGVSFSFIEVLLRLPVKEEQPTSWPYAENNIQFHLYNKHGFC